MSRVITSGRYRKGVWGLRGALDPLQVNIYTRSRYSNRAVTLIKQSQYSEQCVASYVRIVMYFVSNKCVVGGVGSYCQHAGCDIFLVSPDNVVPFHFDLPVSKSLDLPLVKLRKNGMIHSAFIQPVLSS